MRAPMPTCVLLHSPPPPVALNHPTPNVSLSLSLIHSPTHHLPLTMPLDHTSFPTVIDRILKHCDRPTLLAWRATSQAYRCRINKIVYGHVALVQAANGYSLVLPSQAGPRAIDFLPLVDVSISTLDLYLTAAPAPQLVKFIGQLGNLRTIRRFGHERECHFVATLRADTTVVDYISLWPKETISLVPGAVRHILHLNWNGEHTGTVFSIPFWVEMVVQSSQPEIVVVIHAPRSDLSKTLCPFTALYSLVEVLSPLTHKGARITIVGLERLSRRQISVTSSHKRGDAKGAEKAFKEALVKHLQNSNDHALRNFAQTVTAAVSCVPITDWRRSLGERCEVEGGWEMPRTFQVGLEMRQADSQS